MARLVHVLMTFFLALLAMASPAVVAIHEPRAATAAPNQKGELPNQNRVDVALLTQMGQH
jgi:hypothetical protein